MAALAVRNHAAPRLAEALAALPDRPIVGPNQLQRHDPRPGRVTTGPRFFDGRASGTRPSFGRDTGGLAARVPACGASPRRNHGSGRHRGPEP
ncbi:hypothetical protein ACU686_24505 [Yinghuangia aomiensis]